MWRCPLCETALFGSSVWTCQNGHCFDVAKAGYVNLLPVQKKKSKQPGDSKAMLKARRDFHQAGGYQPLMNAVAGLLKHHLQHKDITLLDAGCGEGSYLAYCQQFLGNSGYAVNAAGSDISRTAAEFAARQHKHAQFAVASSFDLPLEKEACDAILQIFAPGDDNELHRVLKPDGVLINVSPGPLHLMALKKEVYRQPRPHTPPSPMKPGWQRIEEKALTFKVDLSSVPLREALMHMTPFAWRLTEKRYASVLTGLNEIEADFILSVWTKSASQV